MPLAGVSGVLGAATDAVGGIGRLMSMGDIVAGAGGAAGSTVSSLVGGPAAALTGEGANLSDEQFIDLVAVLFAGCPFPIQTAKVGAMWKSNFKSYVEDPDDLTYLKELGVISSADPAGLTKADKQFICLFALVVSSSARKTRDVESDWKPTRADFRSAGNMAVLKSWGVIS